jgi:hypothetical protein
MNYNAVQEARLWLGTPFCLHGRIKSVGCDCLGLIVGVARELELKDKFAQPITNLDQTGYHLLSDGRILRTVLDKYFTVNSCVELGNLALFTFDNNPIHLAIIGDYPGDRFSVIHANASVGKVVEHRFCGVLKQNLIATYEFTNPR